MRFEWANLEVTNVCNFACKFCAQIISTRERCFISMELAEKALSEMAEMNIVKDLMFHLIGEPLLHPELAKIAKIAKEKGFRTHLFTNGWLLGEREDVLKYIDRIELSIQLLDKDEFMNLRPGTDYDKYVERIKKGLKICSGYPLEVDFAFLINPFQKVFNYRKELNIIPPKREIKSLLTEKFEIDSKLKWNVIYKMLETWDNVTFEKKVYPAYIGACPGLQKHFSILCDGTVTTCCKDYDGLNKIGDLNKEKLSVILDSKRVKKCKRLLSLNILPPSLPYCRRCRGGDTIKGWFANQVGSIFFHRVFRPLIIRYFSKGDSKAN